MSIVRNLDIYFPDGSVHLTSSQVEFSHNGNSYVRGKVSDLQDVEVEQSSDFSNQKVSLTFSSVDNTLFSAFTSQAYKGKRIVITELEMDDAYNVIDEDIILDGAMQSFTNTITNQTKQIKLSITPVTATMERQNALDLGVAFAEYINDDKKDYWGKRAPSTGNRSYKYKAGRDPLDP